MAQNSKHAQPFGFWLLFQLAPVMLFQYLNIGVTTVFLFASIVSGLVGGIAARISSDGRYLLTTPGAVLLFWLWTLKKYDPAPSAQTCIAAMAIVGAIYLAFKIRKTYTQSNP